MSEEYIPPEPALTGDCSVDCLVRCAYPGRFSECELPAALDDVRDAAEKRSAREHLAVLRKRVAEAKERK